MRYDVVRKHWNTPDAFPWQAFVEAPWRPAVIRAAGFSPDDPELALFRARRTVRLDDTVVRRGTYLVTGLTVSGHPFALVAVHRR